MPISVWVGVGSGGVGWGGVGEGNVKCTVKGFFEMPILNANLNAQSECTFEAPVGHFHLEARNGSASFNTKLNNTPTHGKFFLHAELNCLYDMSCSTLSPTCQIEGRHRFVERSPECCTVPDQFEMLS